MPDPCREPEEAKEGGEEETFEAEGYTLPPPVGAPETWAEAAPETAGYVAEGAAGFEAAGGLEAAAGVGRALPVFALAQPNTHMCM